ncbi:MAG: thioredoxin family protein, partial [Phycisphaerales bacterium]|nr:thioredoxin family protein [Phycisphaerales bacterium]
MRTTQRRIVTLAVVALTGIAALSIQAEDGGAKSATPQELGTISWRRGFDAAAAESKRSGRPLLILFQEVPGCGTCRSYGDRVLSHPLIRDAAESLFVPVAVYNNIPGDDENTLKSFKEPAWNNPVVR